MADERVPLITSDEAIAALIRLGCYSPRKSTGSHQPIRREIGGRTLTQTVVLDRNPLRRGTLTAILEGLQIELDEFLITLGGRHARSVRRRRS